MATNYVSEGKHIAAVESALVHPSHSDGLVNSGDQVVKGALVGVALVSAAASTDSVNIAAEGIWSLSVAATDASGNSAVAFGDRIYVDAGSNADLTKNATKTPFGIALGAISSGQTGTISVKVTGLGS
jgi:predicted RecA/RadA family phage recombinase